MDGRFASLFLASIVGALVLIVGASYVKFYNERTENYKKHMYVLQYECRSGRQLAQIQYNAMTYDGTQTNCSEALVFTNVPPVLGAMHDMWVASPFFSLMYATDWKIQVAYALFGIVAIVTAIRSWFIYKSQQEVLKTFSSTNRNLRVTESSIDERPRLLIKKSSQQTEAHRLASLLMKEPVFVPKHEVPSTPSY